MSQIISLIGKFCVLYNRQRPVVGVQGVTRRWCRSYFGFEKITPKSPGGTRPMTHVGV